MKTKAIRLLCASLLVCLLCGCSYATQHDSSATLTASPPNSSSAPSSVSSPTPPPAAEPDRVSLADLSIEQRYAALEDSENWYYFDDGIYSIRKDSGTRTLVYQTDVILDYAVVGYLDTRIISDDWIYYVDTSLNICRVRVDGTDHAVIENAKQIGRYGDEWVSGLAVVGKKLIIRTNFVLYCYDMETKETTEVWWDARTFQVVGDKVYFCGKDASIIAMDITTEEITTIFQGDSQFDKERSKNLYKNFLFIDDVMYYYMRRPDGLYRYQDGESELISDDANINEFSLCAYDGMLYFMTYGDGSYKLIRYNPKNEDMAEILTCDSFRAWPKIVDGYFYYPDSSYVIREIEMNFGNGEAY